jgi:hypothetical protein
MPDYSKRFAKQNKKASRRMKIRQKRIQEAKINKYSFKKEEEPKAPSKPVKPVKVEKTRAQKDEEIRKRNSMSIHEKNQLRRKRLKAKKKGKDNQVDRDKR